MKATEKAMVALETAIRARVPLVGIETTEESRVVECVRALCDRPMMSLTGDAAIAAPERLVFIWTHTKGVKVVRPQFINSDGMTEPLPEKLAARYDEAEQHWAKGKETNAPYGAIVDFCAWARAEDVPESVSVGEYESERSKAIKRRASVLVMHDLHRFLGNAEGNKDLAAIRGLRDLFYDLLATKSFAVITAPSLNVLGDSDKEIVVIRWPLPDVDELTALVRSTARKVQIPVDPGVLNGGAEVLAQALTALTWAQAGFVLRQSMVMARELSADKCGPIISQMKAAILRQQQGIELIEPEPIDHIGGLDMLKAAVAHYPSLLTTAAKAANVRPPRAILFVGPAGTGKSLACKAIGGGILPILRWSPAESKNMYVGNTAQNVRAVLDAADAINLCVLWIDEIDLVFNEGGDRHEVSSEMQQMLLTWMQERKSSCIVVATSNYPDRLPAPLRDRFEDRWFVDLPRNKAEALQVINIHLQKRDQGHLVGDTGLQQVAGLCVANNVNPRGVEQAIEAAHRRAWTQGQDLDVAGLVDEILRRVQMSRQAGDAIQEMRERAMTWAMPASSAVPDQTETTVQPDSTVVDL